MDMAHLAGGPDHSILDVVVRTSPKRHPGVDDVWPIIWMNELEELVQPELPLLRAQPEDAVHLVGPGDDVRNVVALPVADMREALGFGQAALALAQAAQHQQTGQGVGEPAADGLKQLSLLRRPDARVRALAEPEHVRLAPVWIPRHEEPRLHTQLLGHPDGQRMIRAGSEGYRARRRSDDSQQCRRVVVHGHVVADAEESGEFRPRA